MRQISCAVITLLLAGLSSAYGLDRSKTWGIGGDIGAAMPANPSAFRSRASMGWAAGAHLKYHLDKQYGVALVYDHFDFSNSTVTNNMFHGQVFARLLKDRDWTTFVALGLGYHRISNYIPSSYGKIGFMGEFGLLNDLCKSFSYGVKVAYYWTAKESTTVRSVVPSLFATWYFGDGGKTAKAMDETPKEVRKAPEAVKFAEKIKESGSVELHVAFDSGNADLKSSSDEDISRLAEYLKDNPNARIVLEGHTDSTGSASKNKKLSQERADAVKDSLVNKFAIDATRVEAIGYGATKPVASNDTAEGRAKNRRVIATLAK